MSAPTGMVGKNRVTAGKGKGKGKAKEPPINSVPEVYQDMLAEALPTQQDRPERPLKRRMTDRQRHFTASSSKHEADSDDGDEDQDIEFEDVLAHDQAGADISRGTSNLQQTAVRSDDDSGASDIEWDPPDFDQISEPHEKGDLVLTLTTRSAPKQTTLRRKAVTKAERSLRLEIHKMHILCLLSYFSRRNEWCNDAVVQSSLKPLLDKKMLQFLRPKSTLSQFGRAESLKRGIEMVSMMWRKKFTITARGMRRSLWAENSEDLQNYKPPSDGDPAFQMSEFRDAAQSLGGSRDLGAQLYCALLRGSGLDVRLVCSLQALPFNTGSPSMPKGAFSKSPRSDEDDGEALDVKASSTFGTNGPFTASQSNPRRRLGHPHAAGYLIPEIKESPTLPAKAKGKIFHESPYPIIWVEVFDEAHQKWFPVDPHVTESIAKPRAFEPPASDRENSMVNVVAFEDDGCAKDVTRRYARAFNSKTRKNRIDSTIDGATWWNQTMRLYSRAFLSDVDQIEDTELAAIEAREPMPKNITDFKDHPIYALVRHLKRNEVLVRTQEIGKVAAGRDSGAPGARKLESVYRRRDVKIARSSDAWYRLGRELKVGELPIKVAPPKRKVEDDEDDKDDQFGTNLYSIDQTELYTSPPIVNGRVPKNSFGNIDIFVPSMVPHGGIHITNDEAPRAATVLGIDYSDALTGFEFRGRHGTAVLKGAVVAIEYREAVEAVLEGFQDERTFEQERSRTIAALKMWRHFLMSLRIKQRIDGYEVEGEKDQYTPIDEATDEEMRSEEEYSDFGGGGFLP